MHPSGYSTLFTLGLLADRSPRSPPAWDDASAFYFTLKTGKRDTVELRSFLYLDLADNKPHARSHRRKFSLLSKSTSWTCTADVKSVHDLARTVIMPSPAPVQPARRRTSKESLRSIPSPKPAPSATLPELPITSPVPSIVVPPSSLKKRPASTSTAPSSPLSSTSCIRRPASLRSASINSDDRRRSRMDALACLEGRSRAPNRIPRTSALRKNFMSFSDDEDEKSSSRESTAPTTPAVEDASSFADVEDEADAILPVVRKRDSTGHAKPARPAKPGRKRRSTLESWFPLKSFIDFKDDDLSSWNWRSFIEIGGVA